MPDAAARPRNVLLIVVDQWRADCLSYLGHPCLRTPNLDALCADGVTFRNHFTQAVPCGPGRASLHTGLYMMNHRVAQNSVPLDARHTNLALEMRKRQRAYAEERAQKAPIKILFPILFLIMPSLFIVILLPVFIRIADAL